MLRGRLLLASHFQRQKSDVDFGGTARCEEQIPFRQGSGKLSIPVG